MVKQYQQQLSYLLHVNKLNQYIYIFSVIITFTFSYPASAATNDIDSKSVIWTRTFEEKAPECGFKFESSPPKFGWLGYVDATPLTVIAVAPEGMSVKLSSSIARKGGPIASLENGDISARIVTVADSTEITISVDTMVGTEMSFDSGEYDLYFESDSIPSSFPEGELVLDWVMVCS
ncbi:hypothetical protein L4D09_13170 [Photobacterium makurazakiensis]|uniref:hypothetical protein n=1 Tax=Photobacterium makurazakiensis TaxID=2910234 RepID=UPI003D0F2EF6